MNLLLTSDFPSTTNDAVVARIRAVCPSPRVAWIAPASSTGRARFPAAREAFRSFGVEDLEYCDIEDEWAATHRSLLDRYDAVYLSGGDPLLFRDNLRRTGFDGRLREFAAAERLIVGASGGAMQLTSNVSLFRLLSETVDAVVSDRHEFAGLGMVSYELLAHLNRHDASFLEKVREYSESASAEVVAVDDGAAVQIDEGGTCKCFGAAVRFRGGIRSPIETAA
jgi:peptidase E